MECLSENHVNLLKECHQFISINSSAGDRHLADKLCGLIVMLESKLKPETKKLVGNELVASFKNLYGLDFNMAREITITRNDGNEVSFDWHGTSEKGVSLWCNHGNWYGFLDLNLVLTIDHHLVPPIHLIPSQIRVTKTLSDKV